MTCRECKYWAAEEFEPEPDIGDCHAHPPIVIRHGIHGVHVTGFPEVYAFEWCGEFVSREAQP